MPDRDNGDDETVILYLIDDAVFSDADSPGVAA
jgi:hypothetical protein